MLITEVEGEEESVARVSLEDSTVGGGFHEDPTNQDLIQIPTRRRSRLHVCVCGGERRALDRKSTRLNSSHIATSRMPSSA